VRYSEVLANNFQFWALHLEFLPPFLVASLGFCIYVRYEKNGIIELLKDQ